MDLSNRLLEDYKEAMRQRLEPNKTIINFVIAQIKNKKIELSKDPSEEDVIAIIKKEIKSRQESLTYLIKANKTDEIEIENQVIEILKAYLPEMMSYDQLKDIINATITELGITDVNKQRGILIGSLMSKHKAMIDAQMMNEIINSIR